MQRVQSLQARNLQFAIRNTGLAALGLVSWSGRWLLKTSPFGSRHDSSIWIEVQRSLACIERRGGGGWWVDGVWNVLHGPPCTSGGTGTCVFFLYVVKRKALGWGRQRGKNGLTSLVCPGSWHSVFLRLQDGGIKEQGAMQAL